MKRIIFTIFLISTTLAYSQNKFVFKENGLVPAYTISYIDSVIETEMHKKTLKWIKNTYKNPDVITDTQNNNDFILLTDIKNNALNQGKLYYHIKYTIKISFENGKYRFEPIEVQSRLNSKYDMGWKDFDLKNGDLFFKKGRVIKKTKSYVTDIPAVLNEVNINLYNYLISEKSAQ